LLSANEREIIMKALILILSILAAAAAQGALPKLSGDMHVIPQGRPKDEFDRFFTPQPPNEITRGPLTYSGASVELFKFKRPLQLLNPFAPDKMGSGEANLARDMITRRSIGIKIFAISF
jgi:hypothetical protein